MSGRLLLSDYAGHPFTMELATALQERGELVTYTYCAAALTPKGLAVHHLDMVPVSEGLTFEKYRPWKRLWSEIRYGLSLSRVVWSKRPTTHVVCNMPVVSATIVWLLSLPLRVRFIVWFQDVQSGLAASSLGHTWQSRALSALETFVLRRASRLIAISSELADEADRRGVSPQKIRVMENWAPVEKLPVLDRDTQWLRETRITSRPLFVYSGTLARKHDPSLLLDLAQAVQSLGGHVGVVSEGEGADYVKDAIHRGIAPPNISVFPYQPFDRLAEVLASADVLVVILEPEAGRFSVPSKTLSYLCASRAILASMPATNSAALLLTSRSHAGVVAEPDDRNGFISLAVHLASDGALRNRLGGAGRAYAERHFTESAVVGNFLDQIDGA